MKKILVIALTFALVLVMLSCSTAEQPLSYGDPEDEAEAQAKLEEMQQFLNENTDELDEMKDYDSAEEYAEHKVAELTGEDQKDDEIFFEGKLDPYGYVYENIPSEIYTTPADENGYGGVFFMIDGHLESFMSAKEYDPESFSDEMYDSMYFADIITPDGNEIVIYNTFYPILFPTYTIEDYQNMAGKDVRVWFEYHGYSEKKDVAMGTFFFMTDDTKSFDECPIELDVDVNAAYALNHLSEELSVTCSVDSDYSCCVIEAECPYSAGMDTDKVAQEYVAICKDFFENQELYLGEGSLTFTYNGKEKALYEFWHDTIDTIKIDKVR